MLDLYGNIMIIITIYKISYEVFHWQWRWHMCCTKDTKKNFNIVSIKGVVAIMKVYEPKLQMGCTTKKHVNTDVYFCNLCHF